MKLRGEVFNFELNGNSRKYMVVTVPFETAKKIFQTDVFNALTQTGEQRAVFAAHARKLRKEMLNGKYTPAAFTVGIRDSHKDGLSFADVEVDEGDGPRTYTEATLELKDGEYLPTLDGGHRTDALNEIGDSAAKLPVTALVMLDGNTALDFLNLQSGRTVDRAHMLSLNVARNSNVKDREIVQLALEAGRILSTNSESPFHNLIKFDSTGLTGIPVSTLASKGASDIGTSLVGGARIAKLAGKDAAWLAACVLKVYKTLKEKAPELLVTGMVLTPPPHGTRGSATMLVGLGNMLAYRLAAQKLAAPTDKDLEVLLDAAKKTCDQVVKGSFSGPVKRSILGDFADKFFADIVDADKTHEGVPTELVNLLSTSTFAVSKLEKPKKVKEPKAPKAPKVGKRRGRKKAVAAPTPKADPEAEDFSSDAELPDGALALDDAFGEPTADAPWDESEEEVQA